MDFYLILKDVMDEKNLSIPDVARMCGLADGTIRSVFVRKQKKVALEVAFKLSKGLDVSLERLNGMEEKKKSSPNAGITTSGDDLVGQIMKCVERMTPEQQRALLASFQALLEQG